MVGDLLKKNTQFDRLQVLCYKDYALPQNVYKKLSLAALFLSLKRGFLFSLCPVHSIQQSCAQGVALSPTCVPIKLFS